MRIRLDRKLARVGSLLPIGLLRTLLRLSLGEHHVALTLHRVRAASPAEMRQDLSIDENALDAVLDLLVGARPGREERWLTVTFDDGYEDAAAYVESRSSRYPGVDFILFVCAEKAERGAGFRWDLAELSRRAGEPPERATGIFEAALDVEAENDREDLRRVGRDPGFEVARVDRLRALAAFPNVSVGNHTNCHFELSALDPERARLELERSHASFERLFGRQRHFAFAYGYGYFDESHVQRVRSLGACVIWSTGQSTYAPVDRAAGAVLPRIVVDGPWGIRGTAAVIAGRALATRVLGVRSVARHSHGRAHRQGVR